VTVSLQAKSGMREFSTNPEIFVAKGRGCDGGR
jgi:hypothetical protein